LDPDSEVARVRAARRRVGHAGLVHHHHRALIQPQTAGADPAEEGVGGHRLRDLTVSGEAFGGGAGHGGADHPVTI
jgi:hypothetical protein